MIKRSLLTTAVMLAFSASASNITPFSDTNVKSINLKNQNNKHHNRVETQLLNARGEEQLKLDTQDPLIFGSLNRSNITNTLPRVWNGDITTDRVLAILIDFPDHLVNTITSDHTQNYYADYSPEHYQNMLFSHAGYKGPQNQTHISLNQYFIDQSGGSYQVEGQVAGWYTAQHNAAIYGAPTQSAKDSNVAALVLEAISHAANDPAIDLSYFDQEDKYDYNNNGNFREPDGIIDHVMVFHSSIDEAVGGGILAEDAIWSHRSDVNFQEIGDTGYKVHNYTIQPIDAAAGVSAHEFGHDLGLPDEYDLDYTEDGLGKIDLAPGSLVGFWSAMSVGSYGGEIPGTAPTGLSPFAKQYLQTSLGGNWFVGTNLHEEELTSSGGIYKLDAASVKGHNNDYIRIDLEDKEVQRLKPNDGKGFITPQIQGDDLIMFSLDFNVDLTDETVASLSFMTDYDADIDGALGQVVVYDEDGNGFIVGGNISNEEGRLSQYLGSGFTGSSNGLTAADFNLHYFLGQNITISIRYYAFSTGFIGMMFDDIQVNASSGLLANFDADNTHNDGLSINGFEPSAGLFSYPHYYLVEWRQHSGIDHALANTWYGASYTPGMLVWYVDTSFRPEKHANFHNRDVIQGDNLVAHHPGEGWLGLVDADRNPIVYNTGEVAGSALQIRDASFSLDVQKPFDWRSIISGIAVSDPFINNNPRFIDWDDYSNYLRPATGRNLPSKGIIIDVLRQSEDKSVAEIKISKVW